ncbi:Eco57I restriction-modification methylase domain-containing protein [Bacteroides intestinalis]|uniref:Eco57I restriction-modification methylase domain-containing protein n=1 Tax=Bacteroides intestinalis TaxID=329854 RepID=UPI000E527785|nr:N-6 DNA methylase [Bacteroides intestinalis]RGX87218.1 adenine methyltransferase [Bacteroides intestinalis]
MDVQEIKNTIHALVEKYESNRNFYRTPNFNETQVRNEFLDPLFEVLGWDIRNMSGKKTNEREVLLEESLKADAATHSKKPDYTFRLFGERKFFLEAKKPCVDISTDDNPAKQVRRYGYTANLKISVLSNFEDLYIYDTSYKVEDGDTLVKARIKAYHYTDYENVAEELLELVGKESVYTGHFEEVWDDIELNVVHQSVDSLFLEQINQWRLMLGQQILSCDPDLEIDYLGDIVQSYINKILFLRVCEDRNIETYQRLLTIADHNSHKELVVKFKEADNKYNSGLFEELISEDVIGNISSSFWMIIRQLYFPESPYSFTVLSSDILGRIYEIFLAEKLAVVDGELKIVKKPENAERDIVTTPNFVVREILHQTAAEIIQGKTANEINNLKCADIACGSGAFLLELYQLLYDSLVDYYFENDRSKLVQTSIDTYKLPYEMKRNLLVNCIYGVDKDFNAVEACKFGLLLKLLEDEDVNSLSSFHPILPDLSNNIFYGNSLLSTADVPADDALEINPFDFGDRTFDLIVGNPPYMKTEDIKAFTPKEKSLYEKGNRYTSAYKQYDKYFLFIERALNLLKPDGYLGYVVPNKFMKVGAAKELRNFIANNAYLKTMISFGAHQVFADKSTYTCIIVLEKNKHENFKYSEVSDFIGWRVRNVNAYKFCDRPSVTINADTWILCTDEHLPLLNAVTAHTKPLGDIVGDDYIFNGIQTSANKIYVFVPISETRTTYTFKAFDGNEYEVEKAVTKPYFKTAQGADAMSTYRTFKPNARVFFPYKKDNDGHLQLIPLTTIQRRYPLFYTFLMAAKPELDKASRDIQPKPTTADEWYRYGRHQSLEACEVEEKMIVGVLAQTDKYAIDNNGTLVSSGGTAGYCLVSIPSDSQYSIYYIQAILGSIQGEWLASLYGEIFRGGYIARGTKVLKQIPIREIDFTDQNERNVHDDIADRQKRLIELGDKISKAAKNRRSLIPLQRQFDLLKHEQQNVINMLYGMTNDEVSLIPKIKELYAAD